MSEKKRILVIDDEEEYSLITAMRVKVHGYEADFAYDAKSGLEKIASFRPDLIFMDVNMPGMTGWDLCRKLSTDPATKHIFVFLMTATQPGVGLELKAKEAGAVRSFLKPFQEEEVFKAVNDFLR